MGRNFTDSVMQKPVEVPDIATGVSSGVKAGIDLATAADQIEQKKAQTETMKLDLMEKKFTAFDSRLKNLNRANPAIRKQMGERIKEQFQGMGFDPLIVDAVLADPEMGRVYQNISDLHMGKIRGNPANLAKVLQSAEDAGLFTETLQIMQNRQVADQQNAQRASNEKIAGMQAKAKETSTGARLDQGAERIHNKNLDSIKTDKLVQPRVTQIQNLQNALSNFEAGGEQSKEGFQELQQAVRSNLGIKGQTTGVERHEAYFKSLGMSLADAKQFLTGDIANIENYAPEFVDHVKALANNEIQRASIQAGQAVDKYVAGHRSFYSKHPELQQDFYDYVGATKEQFKDPGTTYNSGKQQAETAPPPKPKFDPVKFRAEQIAKGKDPAKVDAFLKSKGF
jgi:hypothetical protein